MNEKIKIVFKKNESFKKHKKVYKKKNKMIN